MRRFNQRTLINLGRKAGLQTSELYGALSGQRPSPEDLSASDTDSNGFRSSIDAAGHWVFRPNPGGRST